MESERSRSALERLEAAIRRIEAAIDADAADPGLAALQERHARLRRDAGDALARLDRLIAETAATPPAGASDEAE